MHQFLYYRSSYYFSSLSVCLTCRWYYDRWWRQPNGQWVDNL